MDGVTAIATVLKMEGVEFIGCIPSNPLIEAAAIAGIRPVVFAKKGRASTWWMATPGLPTASVLESS